MSHSDTDKPNMALFWGCFIALITTAFAFFSRMYLCDVRFGTDFGIDKVAIGALKGAGVWPFAVSIIIWSLFIDKIGYKAAMIFAFACYAIYGLLAFMAYGAIQGVEGAALAAAQAKGIKQLTIGSIILGLGNGTVEAFINPVVATMFRKDKTKWLNILHAGWPGGLVFGGLATLALAGQASEGDWRMVVGLVFAPAVVFLIMLIGARFPKNEREAAGVGYLDMLKEFGAIGALIGFGLVFREVGTTLKWPQGVQWGLTAAVVIAFGVITKSIGRPLLIFLTIVMIPLAITEIGTDGWITGLMEEPMKKAGFNPGWILIYTSAIMMVLRFFAGPIIHKLSPVGLLILSSVLAIAGLLWLSKTGNSGLAVIFAAATLYAFGKTFFWPTMLGITAEQSPKGGALTLNAISGIGMLAVGVLGFPYIGYLQEKTTTAILADKAPALVEQVKTHKDYVLGSYDAVDPVKAETITDAASKETLAEATKSGQFAALGKMAYFPMFMLLCYIGLALYFRSKGGYKAVDIHGQERAQEAEPGM